MRIESESKNAEHISYKTYKKKLVPGKKQNIMMFISIFLVLLLVFLGFAKLMSPDVDIAIGDENNQTQTEEDNYRGGVDNRLRMLQQEDDASALTSEELSTEDAGLVKIPKKPEPETIDTITEEEPVTLEQASKSDVQTSPQNEENKVPPLPSAQVNTTTYRVVVGTYTTQAQAEVASGILQEAGLGVTPHIRQIGNTYTLQVGAYSSKESANNLSNKLLMNNYPARIISE